jgi:hypothetical protein
MKKMFIVAFIVAAAFTACGGKKKSDNTMNTGSGDMGSATGSDTGSGDMGSGDTGSGDAPAAGSGM